MNAVVENVRVDYTENAIETSTYRAEYPRKIRFSDINSTVLHKSERENFEKAFIPILREDPRFSDIAC